MNSPIQPVSLSEPDKADLVPATKQEMKSSLKNRTIFTRDNLEVMRGMVDECIDLIYLDPPFNSDHDYAAPIGSQAAGAEFKDTWTLDEIDLAWHGEIAEAHPGLYKLLETTQEIHGDSMMAYLIYMAVRIMEMGRILKSTGSIYLHCDPTASHYLKLLMDEVFGRKNFRSEIIWRRTNAHNKTTKQYGPIHDSILFYTASKKFTFHLGPRPYTRAYIKDRFVHEDERGIYQTNYLTGPGIRTGESGLPWRGFDPSKAGRHWAIPKSLRKFLPDQGEDMSSHEKLESLYQQKLIVFPKRGTQPMYKQYVGDGVPYQDIWTYQPNTQGVLYNSDECIDEDVKYLENEPERTGYPTQKPVGLCERIIRTSSNEGDIVLDPFCGCATTCVAAEKLDRKWVGIDISPKAAELVKERIHRELGLLLFKPIHRFDIPLDRGGERSKNIKHLLYGMQEGKCNGCLTHFPFQNFEVDHIIPASKGGADTDENLQLLCGYCNRVKGDRTQEYLISQVRMTG